MKQEYFTDFSLLYRSLIPSPVFFAAQRFSRPNCIKAGQNNIRDLFVHPLFHIFSRNDVSGQCLRGAEGESSPQSPPAGAFLKKKARNNSQYT